MSKASEVRDMVNDLTMCEIILDEAGVSRTACGGEGDAEVEMNLLTRLRCAMRLMKACPSEAERLLRLTCEHVCGVSVADQSSELADISLGIEAAFRELPHAATPSNLAEAGEGLLPLTKESIADAFAVCFDERRGLEDVTERLADLKPDGGPNGSVVLSARDFRVLFCGAYRHLESLPSPPAPSTAPEPTANNESDS